MALFVHPFLLVHQWKLEIWVKTHSANQIRKEEKVDYQVNCEVTARFALILSLRFIDKKGKTICTQLANDL